MTPRTSWTAIRGRRSQDAQRDYEDEARISGFRELVHRVRTEAGLTQAALAERMGTTQSAISRMEGGGTRPSFETLERLAEAVGGELVVGVGVDLSQNSAIAELVREGHALVRAG